MRIDVSKLLQNRDNIIKSDVSFDEEKFVCHFPLSSIKSTNVELIVHSFDEFIEISIKLTAKVELICSYTLKPFEYTIKTFDEMHFTRNEDGEDLISFKGNYIDMDKYLFDLITASIPSSPKAPGAVLPKEGNGYRILSDDELKKEKENAGNSSFDCLKDLDFDD